MNKVVSFTKLMMLITFFALFYSYACCQNDKDLPPAPKVKVGIAKLSGSVVNLNKDNQFSLDVPLEYSAEVCSFNVRNETTLYGYIGLG